MLPCAAGFACLPLQAGGTAGSGVGYCTVLGQPSEDAAGAAAVRVSNRTAEDGRQCRLPVVYKCAPPFSGSRLACPSLKSPLLCMPKAAVPPAHRLQVRGPFLGSMKAPCLVCMILACLSSPSPAEGLILPLGHPYDSCLLGSASP